MGPVTSFLSADAKRQAMFLFGMEYEMNCLGMAL